jgi:hypothetical protein
MIISASTGSGFGGALSYIHKEHEKELTLDQKPKILEENMVFGSCREQAFMMRDIANGNARSSRPVLHLSVSFHQEEKVKKEVRALIFDKILEEIGATRDNNQFVIAQHFDADHEHYHILLNKVGFDRSNINTSYIKNKCQVIADKIEIELNLRKTTGRTVVYDPTSDRGFRYTTKEERHPKKIFLDKSVNVRTVKTELREIITQAMEITKNVKELLERLEEEGVQCNATFDTNDKLKGISFRYKDQAFKGTQLGLKSKEIQKHFDDLKLSVIEKDVPEIGGKENIEENYLKSEQEILHKIRKGERSISNLMNTFTKNGFILKGKTVEFEKMFIQREIPEQWIEQNIKINDENISRRAKQEFLREKDAISSKVTTLEKMQEHYSFATAKILDKMHHGEKDKNILLNIFSEYGFILKDKKLIFGEQAIKIEPVDYWIESQVKLIFRAEKNYEKELEAYILLTEKPFHKIPIIAFPKRKKELKQANEELTLKKKNTKKPKLEIWGLRPETSLIESIEREILKLKAQRKELIQNEEKREFIEKGKKPISQLEIHLYAEKRNQYSDANDFIFEYLGNQKHSSDFKDLIWLDKVFLNLETVLEKIEFLKSEFSLSQYECEELVPVFFEKNDSIIQRKIGMLNSLDSKIISKEDQILVTKNDTGDFTGIKGKFLKTFSEHLDALLEEEFQTKPVPSEFFQGLIVETLQQCKIPIEIYSKYIKADDKLFNVLANECTKVLEKISDEIEEKNRPIFKRKR